jgi:hypothetical protein
MMNGPIRRISRRYVATQSRRFRTRDSRLEQKPAEREYSYEEFGQCYDGFWRQVADSLKNDTAQPEYSLKATVAYAISGAPVERSVSNFVNYDFLPVAESPAPVVVEIAPKPKTMDRFRRLFHRAHPPRLLCR